MKYIYIYKPLKLKSCFVHSFGNIFFYSVVLYKEVSTLLKKNINNITSKVTHAHRIIPRKLVSRLGLMS